MALTLSVIDITDIMNRFLIINFGSTQHHSLEIKDFFDKKKQIALHLTDYVLHVCDISKFFSAKKCHMECLFALKNWKMLSNLCHLIEDSPFLSLRDNEVLNFMLGDGFCVGAVVYHFSKFFEMRSPLSSIFPVKNALQVESKQSKFYPFYIENDKFDHQSKPLRFLQAAYRIESIFKSKNSEFGVKNSEKFISPKVLEKFDLRLIKRLPEFDENEKKYFDIEELIPRLKNCGNQNRAYLLGISDRHAKHALAVYPSEPFHFVDPSFGIGTAGNFEELLLFLTNYLVEKYSTYKTFALFEFESSR